MCKHCAWLTLLIACCYCQKWRKLFERFPGSRSWSWSISKSNGFFVGQDASLLRDKQNNIAGSNFFLLNSYQQNMNSLFAKTDKSLSYNWLPPLLLRLSCLHPVKAIPCCCSGHLLMELLLLLLLFTLQHPAPNLSSVTGNPAVSRNLSAAETLPSTIRKAHSLMSECVCVRVCLSACLWVCVSVAFSNCLNPKRLNCCLRVTTWS